MAIHVAHLIYRLDIGGLENFLVELINRLPTDDFRHSIISLTDYSEEFSKRIQTKNVDYYCLNKKEGKDLLVWFKLWQLLRQIKPHILHTCNIATIEGHIPRLLAGVRYGVHAEHGRDIYDMDGSNPHYVLIRKLLKPLIHRFIPVSRDLGTWMVQKLGIPSNRIRPIFNGVDCHRYFPHPTAHPFLPPPIGPVLINIGRLAPIKDHATLLKAFQLFITQEAKTFPQAHLVIVGDGPEKDRLFNLAYQLGLQNRLTFAGARDDIAQLLNASSLFVLSSLAEGTPLTLLEAMACGLPVVATQVGGVAEVVEQHKTGLLVPPNNPQQLAKAIRTILADPVSLQQMGSAARKRVQVHYNLEQAVASYRRMYQEFFK